MDKVEQELLNKLDSLFKDSFLDSGDSQSGQTKIDTKSKFLDAITPYVVSFLETRKLDLDNVSNNFEIPYKELNFRKVLQCKNFKYIYAGDYKTINESETLHHVVTLCRMFINMLNITIRNNDYENKNDIIKNLSNAITDLFYNINAFVLYETVTKELVIVNSTQKKNQNSAFVYIQSRLIDKLIANTKQVDQDAKKIACLNNNDAFKALMELVFCRRRYNDEFFTSAKLDMFRHRREFSPSNLVGSVSDNDKLALYESTTPIVFGTQLLSVIDDSKNVKQFMVQTGMSNHNVYIFDFLHIMSSGDDLKLTNMDWCERMEYLKQELNVQEKYGNMTIVTPTRVTQHEMNIKTQNKTPKYLLLKSFGFGNLRAFYIPPKVETVKRKYEEEEGAEDNQAESDSKKFRL